MIKKEYMGPEMKIFRLAENDIVRVSGGDTEFEPWPSNYNESEEDIFTDEL